MNAWGYDLPTRRHSRYPDASKEAGYSECRIVLIARGVWIKVPGVDVDVQLASIAIRPEATFDQKNVPLLKNRQSHQRLGISSHRDLL
jgi:hypothetical protein